MKAVGSSDPGDGPIGEGAQPDLERMATRQRSAARRVTPRLYTRRMYPPDWEKRGSEVVCDLGVIRVRKDAAVSPRTGVEHDFVVLESPDWVTVIAFTVDGDLVLVRQYRHGVGAVTLELPGGLVEGEATPEEAARAELREETGYAGGEWHRLGQLSAVPALFANRLHVFLAQGVRRAGNPELDPGEDLRTELMDPAEVYRLVAEGEIVHAPVVASLLLLDLLAPGAGVRRDAGAAAEGGTPRDEPAAARREPPDTEATDTRERVLKLIRSHHTASIATVGPAGSHDAGEPHAASVFYAVDRRGRLIFLSKAESRHGRHIGAAAPVAVTVAAPHSGWRDIQGVQLWGRAECLSGAAKASAMAVYLARFPFVSDLLRDPKLVERLRGIEAYRVTPERAALTDNVRGPFGREVVGL
jgi:ADP-ribose pyrophosphatase